MPTKEHYIRAELAADIGASLREIDKRLLGDGTKEKLVVNRRGRIVPHYPFVPSDHHPDAWGTPNYRKSLIHKKVGKTSRSKRGRK